MVDLAGFEELLTSKGYDLDGGLSVLPLHRISVGLGMDVHRASTVWVILCQRSILRPLVRRQTPDLEMVERYRKLGQHDIPEADSTVIEPYSQPVRTSIACV